MVPETTQKAPCSPAKGARPWGPAPHPAVLAPGPYSARGRDAMSPLSAGVPPLSALHRTMPRRCGWQGLPGRDGRQRPCGAPRPGNAACLRPTGRVVLCCAGAGPSLLGIERHGPRESGAILSCSDSRPCGMASAKPDGSPTVVPTRYWALSRARQNRSPLTPGHRPSAAFQPDSSSLAGTSCPRGDA